MAKSIRVTAGLSLQDVGDSIGMPVVTLWNWENGKNKPSGDRAAKLLALLDDLYGVPR
jgi:DNA-binding transcriptional regulator YiaG